MFLSKQETCTVLGKSGRKSNETLGKQTLFAVPLSCDGCVKSVSDSLYKLDGITKVEANLKDQLISVEGSGEPHGTIDILCTPLICRKTMC